MADVKTKYSEEDLQEFRAIIDKKIAKAEEDLAILRSSYKMMPTTELMTRHLLLNHLMKDLM